MTAFQKLKAVCHGFTRLRIIECTLPHQVQKCETSARLTSSQVAVALNEDN